MRPWQVAGIRHLVRDDQMMHMHLNYQIDGHVLRIGAANISASGLKRQDNDDLPAAKTFQSTEDDQVC
jgi:hypothetical protein